MSGVSLSAGDEPAPHKPNIPEYSVSELSAALKRRVEDGFAHVRVRGEISGWKRHGSGHCYFALKDEDALLDAVIWRGTAQRIAVALEEGMEVVCTGRLTTFPARSRYQMVVESVELAGLGALLKLLEERKRRLEAEGLFDAGRKRPLPFLPRVVGVVTSPTGAVIRDILHRLRERCPVHVLVWPVAVQGEGAAAQVAAAIAGFNRLPLAGVPRPDVLIVARGGGSLEDLMAFNEEIVARAAAASAIPLISAVGHETDTTLVDFTADRRAPTPTAAAEMAVPVRLDLLAELDGKGARLARGIARFFTERRVRVEGLGRGLPDPRRLLEQASQRLDDRGERLVLALSGRVATARARLDKAAARLRDPSHLIAAERRALGLTAARLRPTLLAARIERDAARVAALAAALEALSPERVLQRGYAIVLKGGAGPPVTRAAEVTPGAALTVRFADGDIGATADGRRSKREGAPSQKQGQLL